ncbi:uncharacterized protein [Palaemon carinicauda]|uniref:uncharacterized protein isoform X2 n=1 Tax=Palaemon carinicauda TaxID=392227 RepID=UPI0035B5C97B
MKNDLICFRPGAGGWGRQAMAADDSAGRLIGSPKSELTRMVRQQTLQETIELERFSNPSPSEHPEGTLPIGYHNSLVQGDDENHQEPVVSQGGDDTTSLSPNLSGNGDDSIIYVPRPPQTDNHSQTISQNKADTSGHLIREILTTNVIPVVENTIGPPGRQVNDGMERERLQLEVLQLKEENARLERDLAMYVQNYINYMKMGPSDGNL